MKPYNKTHSVLVPFTRTHIYYDIHPQTNSPTYLILQPHSSKQRKQGHREQYSKGKYVNALSTHNLGQYISH